MMRIPDLIEGPFEPLWRAKIWRIVRQVPGRALRNWAAAFLNQGNLISLALAIFTSWVGLESAAFTAVVQAASEWANVIQAFGIVVVGWAAVCFFAAPFHLWLEQRREGEWVGNRYVFYQPKLLRSIRAKPDGTPHFYRLDLPFAEPGSFVYFRIETDNPEVRHLFTANVAGEILLTGHFAPGQGLLQGGCTIRKDRTANLVVVMKPEAKAKGFRVYCLDFSVGNPDDNAGMLGDATPDWVKERFCDEG